MVRVASKGRTARRVSRNRSFQRKRMVFSSWAVGRTTAAFGGGFGARGADPGPALPGKVSPRGDGFEKTCLGAASTVG
jgi:hypothetical protein